MSRIFQISENGLYLIFAVNDAQQVRMMHFDSFPGKERPVTDDAVSCAPMVQIQTTGCETGHLRLHGQKHNVTGTGSRLTYVSHSDTRTAEGRHLAVVQTGDGLQVTSHFQFYDGVRTVRGWTEVLNCSDGTIGLEHVSSLLLPDLAASGDTPWESKGRISIPHNTWYGEAQWRTCSLRDLGLSDTVAMTCKPLAYSSTGSWSTSKYLPMGFFENTETHSGFLWQIENNGSWYWEIGDSVHQLYLQLSGPNELQSHWWKNLLPGETFVTVPAAVSMVQTGFADAVAEMTRYRRIIRRPNRDNAALPVIFNDYMNCLSGDPTTEKLLPLIDAAAEAGCEYFVIDCGWYADGAWWDGVGAWMPSERRFPGGIREPLDYIRSKGMIPGLWLEPEVMGIRCPLAQTLPDSWFFQRHGKRIAESSRWQLDFSCPEVRSYLSGVVRRLVTEYGVGYIKMDYNIDAGIGTEGGGADSCGDGLLRHGRALLAWLDELYAQYPDLIIENCSSGGMRMDYAMLSRHSIQSSSDQTDYRKNAVIASASAAGVCPEQCAVWSYPLKDAGRNQVSFNMINAMLLRIHQSGHLAELSPEAFALVREGICVYKTIRADIPKAFPFWPLGMPDFSAAFLAYGLACEDRSYLAVWRRSGPQDTCTIPLDRTFTAAECLYPSFAHDTVSVTLENRALTVRLPDEYSALLLRLS